jgi:glycosyltransferase involved in cell wall biosynthesis
MEGEGRVKLLVIPKVYPRASVIGGPILIHHRIKNLSKMGYSITVLAPATSEEDHNDTSLAPFCDDIILIDSPGERSADEIAELQARLNRPPFFLAGDGGYDARLDDTLRSLLTRHHFDAIIAEYSMMGQYIEGAQPGIPYDTMTIISVHECYTQAFRQRAEKGEEISAETIDELYKYEFRMYRAADHVLTLTGEDRDAVISLEPDLAGKIHVVPHGVDSSFYTPPPSKSWDSQNILFLGNFRHHPNVNAVHNFMRHCWPEISEKVPEARFYAIGFDPPDELLAYQNERIIVREGGTHDDVRQIYWTGDVFVSPIELGGGFRGKMLEALSCGLPTVSTHLSAFGIDPVNGKEMYVTDNYREFTRHVVSLLTERELRKTMSAMARALGERFDHKEAARKLHATIEKHRTHH